jgi:hypothetical protein
MEKSIMRSKKMILTAAAMSGLFAGVLVAGAQINDQPNSSTGNQQKRLISVVGVKAPINMDSPTTQNDCKGKGCCKA